LIFFVLSFFRSSGRFGRPLALRPIPSGSNSAAWLYQDLVTIPGTTYTVSFAYVSGFPNSQIEAQALTGVELQVLWGPSATRL
jgi:hypothetical protein